MNWHLRLPGALYRQACDRAGSDTALADRVRSWLNAYVAGQSPPSLFAASGGHARAKALTPEARTAIAKTAARARWGSFWRLDEIE